MHIVYILMTTVVVVAFIAAPRESVWKEITNYNHLNRLDSDVTKSKDTKIGPDKHLIDFKVDKKVVTLNYQVEVTEKAPELLTWKLKSGDMKVNKGFIKLIPTKGGTQLVYHRDIQGVKGIPDYFLKPVCRMSMNRVVKHLKERTERGSNRASKPK